MMKALKNLPQPSLAQSHRPSYSNLPIVKLSLPKTNVPNPLWSAKLLKSQTLPSLTLNLST